MGTEDLSGDQCDVPQVNMLQNKEQVNDMSERWKWKSREDPDEMVGCNEKEERQLRYNINKNIWNGVIFRPWSLVFSIRRAGRAREEEDLHVHRFVEESEQCYSFTNF